jgi:hypothetical protein
MAPRGGRVPKSVVAGPSEQELRELLGRRYQLFDRVARPRPGVQGEWRCYKKGTPPTLKVIEGKRTLYYVRPDKSWVHVTFLLTRRASDAALAGRLPEVVRTAIRTAKEFPEGRAVRLELHRLAEVSDLEALLAVKLGTTRRVPRG